MSAPELDLAVSACRGLRAFSGAFQRERMRRP